MRHLMRAPALGTTLVASALIAPQAIAQDASATGQTVAGTSVQLSAAGAEDAQTRAIAAAAPAAVSASATLNGLHVMCSEVTALMWDSSGRAIIDRVRSATLCD